VKVPEDASYYHPYDEPDLQTEISLKERGAVSTNTLSFDNTVAVLPEISLAANPENIVVNTADLQDEYSISVEAKNYFVGEKEASISLDLPEGWTSKPEDQHVTFDKRFDTEQVEFSIVPPENV